MQHVATRELADVWHLLAGCACAQGALWDLYKSLLQDGWKLDANGYTDRKSVV